MSYRQVDLQNEIAIEAAIHKTWYPNTKAELTLLSTAVKADATTKHDTTLETAPGITQPGKASNTRFQNAVDLIINKGRGGNLTSAQLGAAMDAVVATLP